MPSAPAQDLETRRRLLEAAGEIFSEQGFRAATIREICSRANANVAAVNYYFGDKEKLYQEVLRYSWQSAMEKYPPRLGLRENANAEEQLRVFVKSFLMRCLDPGRPGWHGKLMVREMAEPTNFLKQVVQEGVRPNFERLRSIVQALLGKRVPEEQSRLYAMSIAGQCLYYRLTQPVIERLFPQWKFTEPEIEKLAEHITQFSLRAIRAHKQSGAKK